MQSRTTTPTIASQRLRLGSAAAGESSLGMRSSAARYASRPAPPTSASTMAPIRKMIGSTLK